MYPLIQESETSRHFLAEIERFAPMTTERFQFDAFCSVQVFLFLEPAASGAATWDLSPSVSSDYSPFRKASPPQATEMAPLVSGALLLDASSIFSSTSSWNTPLRLLYCAAAKQARLASVRDAWTTVVEAFALLAPPAVPSTAPESPECDSIDLETPYAGLLTELHSTSPWKSWKKLATLLGTSHTQLGRILDGTVSLPGNQLAQRIDGLYKFAQRLQRLSMGNETAIMRLLTTPRATDHKSAHDFLTAQDYRNAFRAVMEAASPRPRLAAVEGVPLRWYDEPSRDLYDDENEFDG